MNYEKIPEWRLWLRALLPSVASLTGSLVFVVIIRGLHLFLLADDPALVIPYLAGQQADDQLVKVYTSVVQQPLDKAFGNDIFGALSTVVLWGIVGWIIYAIADFIFAIARDFRSDAKQVSFPGKGQVVRHPLHNQLVIRILWRFTIGLLLIVLTVSLQPSVSRLLQYDTQLLTAHSISEVLEYAAVSLLGWMVMLHLYVLLFRLFVLRTRVFGEIIY